ncbi:MAG: DUF1902 domain-containing protein [Defluviitaleaceae bacterium]|nr:DUF1902 domain-containing protein [Defluviitaleaceae bacterium]
MSNRFNVTLAWDDEAYVWMATSEDVMGLVLEDGSFDALVQRVRYAVPELLETKGVPFDDMLLDFRVSDFSVPRKERLVTSG